MNFDEGIVAVGFARKQRLDRTALRILLELGKLLFAFRNACRIVLGFAQFDQRDAVVEIAFQALVGC